MPKRPAWTPRNGASAYGTPVSAGPKRIGGGYFKPKEYKEHKAEGVTKPPKKLRKVKPIDYEDDEAIRLLSQSVALRRYKAQHAERFSKALPPSAKQVSMLRYQLGGGDWLPDRVLERFVEFANQLPSGSGERLTRIHWVRAIDMALTGRNELCVAMDEIAISFGYTDALDMETGSLNLPPLPDL